MSPSSFSRKVGKAAECQVNNLDPSKDIEDFESKKRWHQYKGWIAIYWVILISAMAVWVVWLWNLFAPESWRWLSCDDLNTAFKMTAGALGALLYGKAKSHQ